MTGESAEIAVEQTRVVRDPNFVRIAADQGFASFLGRDIELSLLVMSQDLESFDVTPDSTVTINSVPQVVEIARVRLSPHGAANIANNLLAALVGSGSISIEQLSETLARLKQMASERSEDTSDEG